MAISVGTDCAGMEAPLQSFKRLGVPIEHKFWSDIDENVIKTVKANFGGGQQYGDLMERDNSKASLGDTRGINRIQ